MQAAAHMADTFSQAGVLLHATPGQCRWAVMLQYAAGRLNVIRCRQAAPVMSARALTFQIQRAQAAAVVQCKAGNAAVP